MAPVAEPTIEESMARTRRRLVAASACWVALAPVPAFAQAAIPVRHAVADLADIAPHQTDTRPTLPPRELTAHVQPRLGTWEAILSLYRSDDAADGAMPTPRRDLPRRAFAVDRRGTGAIAEER
jgi:hypothetical protein